MLIGQGKSPEGKWHAVHFSGPTDEDLEAKPWLRKYAANRGLYLACQHVFVRRFTYGVPTCIPCQLKVLGKWGLPLRLGA